MEFFQFKRSQPNVSKWPMFIAGLSLASIFIFIFLYFFDVAYFNFPLYVIIVLGGIPLIFQILFKLLKGNLGADSLAAIAIISAVILKEYLAADLIILMLASGQTLESYAMRKASSVLLTLSERMPSVAHRKRGGKIEEIALLDILIGDEIIIYPHETCPVDGIVLEGHGSMDESYLTGEPYEISKSPGTRVLSGSVNGISVLTIRAEKLSSDSRYAAIVEVLEKAEQQRPKIRRLGDQIGAIFAPVALIIAGAAWFFTGEPIRFLSVIVIATPCPLLIAIPITIISAISLAARRAIIIKDPTVLERLPTCRTAIFDKTGTLTYGKPVLTEILTAPQVNANIILQMVASVERYSKHPLSSAILLAAEKEYLPLIDASEAYERAGEGLIGMINNHKIQVTDRKKLLEMNPEYLSTLPEILPGLECIILFDDQYAAVFRFHDEPRPESKSFVRHLGPSHQFKRILLVSGDRESEVQSFSKLLNITEIFASQTPEQKIEIVRNENSKSPTLFMGDGINDAPALTAATVGLAFGEYNQVTAQASGAVIMENTLYKVDELIHLSLKTRKIALQSALGGMALSVIGMTFAALGFMPPVVGAILQECIDVLAILNALRLIWGQDIKIDVPKNEH